MDRSPLLINGAHVSTWHFLCSHVLGRARACLAKQEQRELQRKKKGAWFWVTMDAGGNEGGVERGSCVICCGDGVPLAFLAPCACPHPFCRACAEKVAKCPFCTAPITKVCGSRAEAHGAAEALAARRRQAVALQLPGKAKQRPPKVAQRTTLSAFFGTPSATAQTPPLAGPLRDLPPPAAASSAGHGGAGGSGRKRPAREASGDSGGDGSGCGGGRNEGSTDSERCTHGQGPDCALCASKDQARWRGRRRRSSTLQGGDGPPQPAAARRASSGPTRSDAGDTHENSAAAGRSGGAASGGGDDNSATAAAAARLPRASLPRALREIADSLGSGRRDAAPSTVLPTQPSAALHAAPTAAPEPDLRRTRRASSVGPGPSDEGGKAASAARNQMGMIIML